MRCSIAGRLFKHAHRTASTAHILPCAQPCTCLLKYPRPCLQVLWLCENPCAEDSAYRATVTRYLPQLEKLDNEDLVTGVREPGSRGPLASPPMPHGGGPNRGSPAASRSNSYNTPEPAGIPNLTAVMHEPASHSRPFPLRSSKNILYAVRGICRTGRWHLALCVPPGGVGGACQHLHACALLGQCTDFFASCGHN